MRGREKAVDTVAVCGFYALAPEKKKSLCGGAGFAYRLAAEDERRGEEDLGLRELGGAGETSGCARPAHTGHGQRTGDWQVAVRHADCVRRAGLLILAFALICPIGPDRLLCDVRFRSDQIIALPQSCAVAAPTNHAARRHSTGQRQHRTRTTPQESSLLACACAYSAGRNCCTCNTCSASCLLVGRCSLVDVSAPD